MTEPVSKILVLFKSVPDPYEAAAASGGASAGGKSVINPFDEIAIEEALRIRERGEASEVVGLTIGPAPVDEQVRADARERRGLHGQQSVHEPSVHRQRVRGQRSRHVEAVQRHVSP